MEDIKNKNANSTTEANIKILEIFITLIISIITIVGGVITYYSLDRPSHKLEIEEAEIQLAMDQSEIISKLLDIDNPSRLQNKYDALLLNCKDQDMCELLKKNESLIKKKKKKLYAIEGLEREVESLKFQIAKIKNESLKAKYEAEVSVLVITIEQLKY